MVDFIGDTDSEQCKAWDIDCLILGLGYWV